MKTQLTLRMPGQIPSSFHIHLLGICMCLITACSVFKEKSFFETDSLQRRKSDLAVTRESLSQEETIRLYNHRDSADRQIFAEIIPKGAFRYSLSEGFTGEAERLLIRERQQERRQRTGASRISRAEMLKTGLKLKAQSKSSTRIKQKSQKPAALSLLYLGGILLLFVLIYRFRGELRIRS